MYLAPCCHLCSEHINTGISQDWCYRYEMLFKQQRKCCHLVNQPNPAFSFHLLCSCLWKQNLIPLSRFTEMDYLSCENTSLVFWINQWMISSVPRAISDSAAFGSCKRSSVFHLLVLKLSINERSIFWVCHVL